MTKRAVRPAREGSRDRIRKGRSEPLCPLLSRVAEEVAARHMPLSHKVRILLAFVRALNVPPRPSIETIDDVVRLAIVDPDAYDRLLQSYWLLLGARRRAA
jgi:hypothetical protein